ncbi:Single-stranded-DNA-specific exonuclease RecJ [Crenothrix polyspora]|uniref:Single-stranded-DNA-specific exonuclease RecJ n=1 Tax=Crenothrix polyspora TaxID=360316 RepID=A0A1R4H6Y6_9GAMM|nr:single-stranded-DNA-specific exonuclease RecJ [Crenothrix polyspora]SJM91946.1 Single-stranded-DNA-specific exonuclease RecJ [Crenothrix polyspora]
MYSQGVKKTIIARQVAKNSGNLDNMHPILERILLSRGLSSADDLDRSLAKLPSPWLLSNMEAMVSHLITALQQQQRITILADFDADGATSCALAIKGLQLLGFLNVAFVVPNRFEYAYGLTPEIVELVKQQQPDIILTVDNGISSIEGVEAANALGIKVLITDHHLPGQHLPAAEAIVNPNLVGDQFPSKVIAGVATVFYVLLALRSRLRELNWFTPTQSEPNLAVLLDYVALGTIADVVPLDRVNRILVHQGLMRIRAGFGHSGINALIDISGKSQHSIQATDLGFALGPRLNAAGRMDDMSLGIHCLLADDLVAAKAIAVKLDALNNDRKEVEGQMKQEAQALLSEIKSLNSQYLPAGVCLYDANWHQGVIGILASRMKDQLHRPVIAFASAGKDLIKGSARSIPGVHIRDVLADIAIAHPKLLRMFGGHAMAAGLTIAMHDYPAFALLFDTMVNKRLAHVDLEQKILVDGELSEQEMTIEFADLLQNACVWGQGCPEPVFSDKFEVVQVRIVGQRHLKLLLRKPNGHLMIDAIAFFVDKPEHWLGMRLCSAAYTMGINEFRGNRTLQFMVQYMEKIT